MRNVAPIALDGIEPRDLSGEAGPDFDVVDPSDLLVDDVYQRDPSARTLGLVRRIVAGWSWAKFKPPVVVRVDGRLHVLDGQHTAMAAASHPGVRAIPVLVVAAPEVVDRAAAFVSHAVDRVQASALQVHRAAVVAGDGAAVAVSDLCRAAGIDLLPHAPGHGSGYRPRETVALSTIRGLVGRRGAERARDVLAALAAADLAPIAADHIRAAEALLCDGEYAAEFTADRVTAAMRALSPTLLAEARELAAAKSLPAWRAITATLYRRAPRRPRAKAPPTPPAEPARVTPADIPTPPAPVVEPPALAAPKPRRSKSRPYFNPRPVLPPDERLSTPIKAPRGARTFKALAAIVMPSPEMAAIVGAGPMLRSDAVEAVEKYVRARDLLDPADRRTVVADPILRALLGRDRVPAAELADLFDLHLCTVPERRGGSAAEPVEQVSPSPL